MEAIIGILGPVIEVGKCIAQPVKHQFNYLCCFNNNIQSLRDEAQKLKDANDGLQMRVDAAKNNAQVIYPEVKTWLEHASQSKDIINGIVNDIRKVQKGYCLSMIFSRYSLSRKAKKTAEDLMELHNNCKFDLIAEDAPPAATESLPLGPKEKFVTRKKIEDDVMESLRDRNVNKIGLCGMGGVGKTTMAERIVDRVKEEKLFDEALKVVVSQQVEMTKIQQSIANQLGLTLDADDLETRAYKIRRRLTHTKRILIVVDDVWESLHLKDVGIPNRNTCGMCTVLLTSRDRGVLEEMEIQKIFGIEVLPETEAWLLFREKTGNCVDREDLYSLAQDVAKECKGLPVALVIVGGALRNKTRREVWEDAVVQLRSSKPIDLPRVLSHVYKPLKLSYDYLGNKHARSLFLLCSMFEEDFNIDLEILTWYGVGLDIFEGLRNLDEARNRTLMLVEMLKDRSLLLDCYDRDQVKMHDVVRDMAIYIAPEQQRGGFVINRDAMFMDWASRENYYKDCYWISITNLTNKTKLPVGLKCPSLRLLMMQSGEEQQYNDELRLPHRFFDRMQEMRVLSMERIWITSVPPSTQMLKNLKTLCLSNCPVLETISAVSELLKLEILSCYWCNNIKALPTEIGGLSRLRLLKIIYCINLKTIGHGIISNLISLEELTIVYSFGGWEAKERKAKENAALVELESLTKLTCLEIDINDVSLVAEEMHLPSGIVKYDISIMNRRQSWWKHHFPKMYLEIPGQMNVGNWIKTLLRSTKILELRGDGASQLNLVELENVKYLTLKSFSSVKKLVNTTAGTSVFPLLEHLTLTSLDNLEVIIPAKSNTYSCFENLTSIYVKSCSRLQYLFPMSVAIRCLTQLKHLNVIDCEAMEDILCDDDKTEKDGNIISHHLPMAFPKLEELVLEGLPEFTAKQILDKIVAPASNLRTLQLERLKDDASRVRRVFSSFSNLEYVKISDFNGIKNLMSPSIARNLVHLQKLVVLSCNTMLEVIANDDEEVQATGQMSLFPRLESLDLVSLPMLRSFCQWNHHNINLELPSLVHISIGNCPKMETFTQGPLITPKLERIYFERRMIKTKDLNAAIQQHRLYKEMTREAAYNRDNP